MGESVRNLTTLLMHFSLLKNDDRLQNNRAVFNTVIFVYQK